MSAGSHRGKRGWFPRKSRNLFAVPEAEKSLPEALADLAPELEPVPHGDAIIPEGATPAEDFPQAPWAGTPPSFREGLAMIGLLADQRGINPYDAPLPKTLRDRANPDWRQRQPVRPRGTRHTVPFKPEFAEEGARPRPYTPRNMPRPWLVPDTWRRRSHPLTQQGHDLTEFVQEHMQAITYPSPHASPSEVAAFFRRVSVITGTRSSFEQPARCSGWVRAIGAPAAVAATGPQPTFTPHARRAA